ncbi:MULTISPECIES: DUF3800 domain-containing protein [Pseudomonas syringae group]|nr:MULTISPECIES: DUF3800 domain-containing protein [Pseudomonas syringae group]AVB22974.1 DUF3800 domain-containing protein [Pseudomonas avellanae]POP84597.1 DUF3800 domain-containing protein [Pseudomonas amygdali pv. morsprunorum]SOS31616.1 hypothetical protein CFBP6411_00246 [Pseudomonas syringae group genomosp. 3]SPF10502.1 hypothetical protein PSCFBP3800_00431 [Pseudomonas syringae group genomosp. 3]
MHFYVDESGQTGLNLFDEDQPILYYGVLSSPVDLNVYARVHVERLRNQFGVERLHANELGVEKLTSISRQLDTIQRKNNLCFDIYRINKTDHAAISFFDQVFDQGLNKAVPWAAYWTPLKYQILILVASLFDPSTLKRSWAARVERDDRKANEILIDVLQTLLGRVKYIPDLRAQEIITDALRWATKYPEEIHYNVYNKKDLLQISPNLIGFQSVLHGIASRLERDKGKALSVVVDQQSQFNKAQKWITSFYQQARHIPVETGPGLPVMDLTHIPEVEISCVPGSTNVGLELVDVYLWLFKRYFENKPLSDPLISLIGKQFNIGYTDQVSLAAIAECWTKFFADLPHLSEAEEERIKAARSVSEKERKKHLVGL